MSKRPNNPKLIPRYKYFKIGIRDSARVRIIKEGMNHLFNQRNNELEEAFLQEAAQYTERVLGESRRLHINEEEDHEAMNVIFNNSSIEEPHEVPELVEKEEPEFEEQLEDQFEEQLEEQFEEQFEEPEEEPEEESETLSSEEVLALQERIQAEDQEEYERIRAELEEEEKDEANKDN